MGATSLLRSEVMCHPSGPRADSRTIASAPGGGAISSIEVLNTSAIGNALVPQLNMTRNARNVASPVALRCIRKRADTHLGTLCHPEGILWSTSRAGRRGED